MSRREWVVSQDAYLTAERRVLHATRREVSKRCAELRAVEARLEAEWDREHAGRAA